MIQVEFIYYSTKVGFAVIQAMIEFMKSSILTKVSHTHHR